MKVDKSEEGPGVSSQTETCPFDSRIARSFHHRSPFPSTTRNDRKFGNLTLRSRLAWFLRGHSGVSLPDITLPANEIVLPYNLVVAQLRSPHCSLVPLAFSLLHLILHSFSLSLSLCNLVPHMYAGMYNL